MFEGIRRLLSDALDALEGDAPVSREELDRVLAEMREELIEARARLKGQRQEVESYVQRLEALRERDDVAPGDLAELEAAVRKRRAELAEHREVVADLTAQFKDAMKRRDVLPAVDRRTRAKETLREAGEGGLEDLERLEEGIEGEAAERAARREVEEALGADEERDAATDEAFREAEAAELLEELKRSMGVDPEEEG
jgi:chromosome segregation ATPase